MKKILVFLLVIFCSVPTLGAQTKLNFQPKNLFQKKHLGPKSAAPRMIEVEEEVWFALHEELNSLRDETLQMQTKLKVAEAEIARLRQTQYVEGGSGGVGSTYQVKEEDNLWKIAKKHYKDPFKWLWLFKANINQLDDPDKIYPGQILDIPRYE